MALLQTLFDNFNDGSLDSSKWYFDASSGSYDESVYVTGALTMVANAGNSAALYNDGTYLGGATRLFDFTGSYGLFETVDAPNITQTNMGYYFGIVDAAFNNGFVMDVNDGVLQSGTYAGYIHSVTYSPTNHRWVRMRESGGTVYFDVSPNGLTWTNLTSTTYGFSITNMQAFMMLINSQAGSRYWAFDNFNLPFSSATKTQTGKARITAVVPRTQTGKARIAAVVSRTQTGKANIGATTSRTQTGKARITAVASRTQTGRARITNTVLRTQLGKAAIRKTVTRTQTGKAAIVYTTLRTQTGRANIGVTTLRTQTGTSRIIMGIDYGTKPNGIIITEQRLAGSEKPMMPNSSGVSVDNRAFAGWDDKPQMSGIST